MNKASIVKFLHILHVQNINQNLADWVQFSCIYGKHTHKHGDATPSAGISVTNGTSWYNCLGCGKSMPVADALADLFLMNKEHGLPSPHIAPALLFLEDEDQFVFEEVPWSDPAPKKEFYPYPSEWLAKFYPVEKVPEAMAYLESRHISPTLAKMFDLRFDLAKSMVGFPYKNALGKIAGMRGRSIDPNVEKKYKHFDYKCGTHSNSSLTWYRESELTGSKPLIVVEGEFDCVRVFQHYRNVTAILTALVSDTKLSALTSFPKVYWLSDNDDAGEASRAKARRFFKEQGLESKFHDMYVIEGYKDPAELTPKAARFLFSDTDIERDEFIS